MLISQILTTEDFPPKSLLMMHHPCYIGLAQGEEDVAKLIEDWLLPSPGHMIQCMVLPVREEVLYRVEVGGCGGVFSIGTKIFSFGK